MNLGPFRLQLYVTFTAQCWRGALPGSNDFGVAIAFVCAPAKSLA